MSNSIVNTELIGVYWFLTTGPSGVNCSILNGDNVRFITHIIDALPQHIYRAITSYKSPDGTIYKDDSGDYIAGGTTGTASVQMYSSQLRLTPGLWTIVGADIYQDGRLLLHGDGKDSGMCENLTVIGTETNIKSIIVTFDNLTKPYTRTVSVSGTGSGSFNIKEGISVIASGTMTNGWGMINIDNIPQGTHTFCAIPSSTGACSVPFTVGPALPVNRWGCGDNCSNAGVVGEFGSQEECKAACKSIVTPSVATHAFVINLGPLSWADLGGLTKYLPNITTAFADAITLYGWLGWKVIESKIESGKLVIYLRDTNIVSASISTSDNIRIRSLVLPELAEIGAALVTITAIALRFGYLIIGYSIVNLLTKAVEVAKTQADTEQIRTQTISDMCASGKLTADQCAEALKPPAEKGICESFGFSTTACNQLKTGGMVLGVGILAYIVYNATKKVTSITG